MKWDDRWKWWMKLNLILHHNFLFLQYFFISYYIMHIVLIPNNAIIVLYVRQKLMNWIILFIFFKRKVWEIRWKVQKFKCWTQSTIYSTVWSETYFFYFIKYRKCYDSLFLMYSNSIYLTGSYYAHLERKRTKNHICSKAHNNILIQIHII